MSTGRTVDASPLCRGELDLFANMHEAWDHLVKHVLDASEAWSWAVIIPTLQAPLDAGRRADLHRRARQASAEAVPADLAAVWEAFLELVAAAVERGVTLKWFWEERSRPSGEGPFRVFAGSGILAYLDEEVVRTGFLPFKGDLPAAESERLRRYALFIRCWEKVQHKYQRAAQAGRLVQAPDALRALLLKVPDLVEWERLR
jgi:hypothetical protein